MAEEKVDREKGRKKGPISNTYAFIAFGSCGRGSETVANFRSNNI
jgi:hypothetical protein